MGPDVQALLIMAVAEMYSLLDPLQQERMGPTLQEMCVATSQLVESCQAEA